MSTEQTLQIESTGLGNTLEIAMQIGRRVQGGEVIELVSDLGGGKTAFVRGLANGMGSTDRVHSPTFTLSNQYKTKDLTLHHFDFYRLNEPGIMRDELSEILQDPKAVVAIEWADIIESVLPHDRLTIHIKSTGETQRQFTFTYPDKFKYLTS